MSTKSVGEVKEGAKVDCKVGDNVKVYVRLKEGGKERIQVFSGVVICRRGSGQRGSFTVRRISHGVGVERIFPVICSSIAKVEVESSARVRRAKLYYTRRSVGKKAMLKPSRGQV